MSREPQIVLELDVTMLRGGRDALPTAAASVVSGERLTGSICNGSCGAH